MFRRLLPFVVATLLLPQVSLARQDGLRILTSNDVAFSAEVRRFGAGETLHIRVFARGFDSTATAGFTIAPRLNGAPVQGTLLPGADGSFEGSVAVDDLVETSVEWILAARVTNLTRTAAGRILVGIRASTPPSPAERIDREAGMETIDALSGPVTDFGVGFVRVAGVLFTINRATRLQPGMDRSSMQPRRSIEVRFVEAADGSRIALRIRPVGARGQGRESVRAFGSLMGMTTGTFSLSGVPFSFDATTRWIDASGAESGPATIPVGTRLRVWASYDPATGLHALRVAVSEPVAVGSVVAGRTHEALELDDLSVSLSTDTEFLGADGALIDPASIRTGAFVDLVVFAEPTSTRGPSYIAEQVIVRHAAAATASEARDSDLPTEFVLFQNYPNPFNPETTIRYSVPGRDGTVRLTVFTLLGNRIRVLVDGAVAAGRHEARWDGRDDLGAPVASGVYLYRLEVDGQSAARVMTLIR